MNFNAKRFGKKVGRIALSTPQEQPLLYCPDCGSELRGDITKWKE